MSYLNRYSGRTGDSQNILTPNQREYNNEIFPHHNLFYPVLPAYKICKDADEIFLFIKTYC